MYTQEIDLLPKEIVLRVSPGPDDASIDEFDDLVTYEGILHVVLECARVGLCLLQDLLHHGVTHDSLRLNESSNHHRHANKNIQQFLGLSSLARAFAPRFPPHAD